MGGGSGVFSSKTPTPTPPFPRVRVMWGCIPRLPSTQHPFHCSKIRVRTLLIWNNMKERVDYNNISSLYHLCSLDLLRQSKQKSPYTALSNCRYLHKQYSWNLVLASCRQIMDSPNAQLATQRWEKPAILRANVRRVDAAFISSGQHI